VELSVNKISLVFALFTSFSVMANDPLKACLEFDYDTQKNQCISIVNDGYFSEAAALFCVDFDYSTHKFNCLKSIKNKTYTPTGINICSDYSYTTQKLECIKLTGKDYVGSTGLEFAKLRRISSLANQVKVDIYEGQLSDAIDKLGVIISLTSDYIID
jgi:hypothetical protein